MSLEETDRILSCSYCRVKLAITGQGYLKYHFPPKKAVFDDLFYVPYWRYRGILFSCQNERRIKQKVVDSSFRILKASFLPASLGMRPQALKMRFVTPRTQGFFLGGRLQLKDLHSKIQERYGLKKGLDGDGIFFSALVGETLSLVYSPIILRDDVLYDGILERPLGKISQKVTKQFKSAARRADQLKTVRFIPALCPHCGWDLTGERDGQVLFCVNCASAWDIESSGLGKLKFGFLEGSPNPEIYLPFWRLKVEFAGFELSSYGDLIRLANLPKAARRNWDEADLHFWIPAFKVQPRSFLRIAKRMTISQPSGVVEYPPSEDDLLYPVRLPAGEAAEVVPIMFASFAVLKSKIFPKLQDIQFGKVDQLLVYVPFERRGIEFIHKELKISISSNALKFGRMI